jgi:hypothetical protein
MELPRSMFPNALDVSPLFWAGVKHRPDASESCKERAGRCGRDSWDCREDRLAGVLAAAWSLGIDRSIDLVPRLLTSHRKAIQPHGRFVSVDGTDQSHSLLHHRKTGSANGAPAERTSFEISSLDKEVGPSAGAAKPTHLRPESTLDKRLVQVENLFAFDKHTVPNDVIASPKRDHLNVCTESGESLGDSATALMDVDLDDRHEASSLTGVPSRALGALLVRSVVFSRSENR